MRRQRIALRLPLLLLSLSILVSSAGWSWAQNQSPIEQMAAPDFDLAELHAPVFEATTLRPRSLPVRLPPAVDASESQHRSQARIFTAPTSDHQLLVAKIATLNLRQLAGTARSPSSRTAFIAGTSNKSFTFEPAYLKLSKQTINRASDLNYYGRLPFAGPVILRVAQQAEAHPRITRVLKMLDPQF